MAVLEQIGLGIGGGMLASAMLFGLSRFFRPKFVISSGIITRLAADGSGPQHLVKVANRRQTIATDVTVHIDICYREPVDDGMLLRHVKHLKRAEVPYWRGNDTKDLNASECGRRHFWKASETEVSTEHAAFVRVRVYAKHGLSQIPGYFVQELALPDALVDGTFRLGPSVAIVEEVEVEEDPEAPPESDEPDEE